jgi:hypothetical protein
MEEHHLVFEPFMAIGNGSTVCHSDSPQAQESCEMMDCLYRGRYCAIVPDKGTDGVANNDNEESVYKDLIGAEIVLESARRQCIWNVYGKKNAQVFFDYLDLVHSSGCDTGNSTNCLDTIYTRLDMSMGTVDACVNGKDEVLGTDNVTNTLLSGLIEMANQAPVSRIPEVFINGVPMDATTQALTTGSIFQTICQAYLQAPQICDVCLEENCNSSSEDIAVCLLNLSCNSSDLVDETATTAGKASPPNNKSNSNVATETENMKSQNFSPPTNTETTSPFQISSSENDAAGIEAVNNPESPKTPITSETTSNENSVSAFDKLTQILGSRDMDTLEMLQNCGVNLEKPDPVAKFFMTGDLEQWQSSNTAATAASPKVFCDESDADHFTNALQNFEMCAGFDLLEMATKGSDSLGNVYSDCLKTLSEMSGPEESAEQCAKLVLANDRVARTVGSFLEYNTYICPCLPPLHRDIPKCVYHTQAEDETGSTVLLDGSVLKLTLCLLGEICSHLDSLCETEVTSVDACLPKLNGYATWCETTKDECQKQGALLMTVPPPLFGANFPRRCQPFATAKEEYMQARIIERYNQWRKQCVSGAAEDENNYRIYGDPEELAAAPIEMPTSSQSGPTTPSSSSSTSLPPKEQDSSKHSPSSTIFAGYHHWNEVPPNTQFALVASGLVMGLLLVGCILKRICAWRTQSTAYSTLETRDGDASAGQAEEDDDGLYQDEFEDEAA